MINPKIKRRKQEYPFPTSIHRKISKLLKSTDFFTPKNNNNNNNNNNKFLI